MAWEKPKFNSHEVNAAGATLIDPNASSIGLETAYAIVNNWRGAHYRPLNTFQLRLRNKAQEVDGNSLVAQRIKRLSSIRHKLERYPTMRLAQMQDIGGCRAIVSTMEHLKRLTDIYALREKERTARGVRHKLVDEKDYINRPKSSGYRGVHMVFRYHTDNLPEYDGLKIEIQFRTYLQHALALADELRMKWKAALRKLNAGLSEEEFEDHWAASDDRLELPLAPTDHQQKP